MPKMMLELVDSLNASLQFFDKVEKEQRENIAASQMCSNKQELCSEATSHKNDNQKLLLLQGQEAVYPEGIDNKIASHTGYDNNQLKLDSEITCKTNHYSSLADQLGNPAWEGQNPCSDSISTWDDITICQLPSPMLSVPVSLQNVALQADVDTAAAVTIISGSIFQGAGA